MKTKILAAALLASALSACDHKVDEKNAMAEVMKVHDAAMGHDEVAVKNKDILDSLADDYKSDPAKLIMPNKLSAQLNKADNDMEQWMHSFNAEYNGKSHTEIMEYLNSQRLILLRIDSQLVVGNTLTKAYLLTTK